MDQERTPLFNRKASSHALELLRCRPSGVIGEGASVTDRKMIEKAEIRGVFFPWMNWYKIWWTTTVIGAIGTLFFGPFQIAFQKEPGGTFNESADWFELGLTSIFIIDIFVHFNLAYYRNELIIFERRTIVTEYIHGLFLVDFVGVFPFETAGLWISGHLGETGRNALLFSLLRMLRFLRLHRLRKLSTFLQYDARVSLFWFTLTRNFAAVLALTHMEACLMYFLARLRDFDEETWLGPLVTDMTGFDRYVTSLYWSIVTFCTVGYGDFSPSNSIEQIWGSIFMLVNVVVAAWIIGSITLLIVKGDEKTGEYRDSLQTLQQYGEMNHFDKSVLTKLKAQLRLEFNNREISDEQVLKNFPSAVRRKILRKLYLKPLVKTQLMLSVRPQFVDAFLASCTVEIFSPGEEIVERGAILSDLFLLVGGVAEITTPDASAVVAAILQPTIGSFSEDDFDTDEHLRRRKLEEGDFIGDIGFFTESPQVDSVACLTVCKTLTISQATYKLLAQDHPGSAGQILSNLLTRVKAMQVALPSSLSVLRAGSVFGIDRLDADDNMETTSYDSLADVETGELDLSSKIQDRQDALTAVADLVRMHMDKQLDDQTTRLLFAASRGDTSTIALMCDHGFEPDNADYDNRTALMVAAMKGNTDVVRLLLKYRADPNLIDMHSSTALLEAVKSGHEVTMNVLLEKGAMLNMSESLAASILCQAVHDGDIVLLRRLLKAGIQVDAADYDKRTAAHVAAGEGNVTAIQVLSEYGANLSLKDRWNNTASQEAKRFRGPIAKEFVKFKV